MDYFAVEINRRIWGTLTRIAMCRKREIYGARCS